MIRLFTFLRYVAFALLVVLSGMMMVSAVMHGDPRLAMPLLPFVWGFLAFAVPLMIGVYAWFALRSRRGGV